MIRKPFVLVTAATVFPLVLTGQVGALFGREAMFSPQGGGSPSVYLRYGTPEQSHIIGATNATPMVIQTESAHGLSAGQTVNIRNVCSGANLPSPASGVRKVKAVVDSTHFSVTDTSGADIAGTGAWCTGGGGSNASVGAVQPYTLISQPRGYLDGPGGSMMRRIALGTQNGLISLIVDSSHTATITTSYDLCPTADNCLSTGDQVTVWNTTDSILSAPLSGTEYTVTRASSTTFTFSVNSGIVALDYTHNDHCGPKATPDGTIGGTDNCVRISQFAVSNNPNYTMHNGLSGYRVNTDTYNTTLYDAPGFGGQVAAVGGGGYIATAQIAAVKFLVDQTNQAMLNALIFWLTHFERISGVNFPLNEMGGTQDGWSFLDQMFSQMQSIGMLWAVGNPYMTGAVSQAPGTDWKNAVDKIYNNLNTVGSSCNADIGQIYGNYFPNSHNAVILASGTAQAADSTHITLANGDTAADNYYNNNIVYASVTGGVSVGLISAYNGSTKVATVAWDSTTPSAGAAYKIYASISRSGTTITGYNTLFVGNSDSRAQLAAGDALMGLNRWGGNATDFPDNQSYIPSSATITDSTITGVINNSLVTANSTPSLYWFDKAWKSGDCGMVWMNSYFSANPNSFPAQFPPVGGAQRNTGDPLGLAYGSNNIMATSVGRLILDLAFAGDDPRAAQDLTDVSAQLIDQNLGFDLQLLSGLSNDGVGYGPSRLGYGISDSVLMFSRAVTGYPSIGITSPWQDGFDIWRMFGVLPGLEGGYGQVRRMFRFGSQSDDNTISGSNAGSFSRAGSQYLAPLGTTAKLYKSAWPVLSASQGIAVVDTSTFAPMFSLMDFRWPTTDFTTQPRQYYFHATDPTTSANLAGKTSNRLLREDAMISRTGWNFTNCPSDRVSACSGGTDAVLMFEARSFAQDHDNPVPGRFQFYQTGYLISSDVFAPGAEGQGGSIGDDNCTWRLPLAGLTCSGSVPTDWNGSIPDTTKLDNTLELGTLGPGGNDRGYIDWAGNGHPVSYAEMPRWASGGAGAFGTAYGDSASRYAYSMADVTAFYKSTYAPSFAHRHLADMGKTSGAHVIFDFWDVGTSNKPESVTARVHYAQNGNTVAELRSYTTGDYLEGFTTCPGGGGCANLNTTRVILSLESGAPADTLGPARNAGLATSFFSPGTITVRDDNVPVTITGISKSNPAVVTAPGHGLTGNTAVQFYRGGGDWDGINGIRRVTVIDANSLSVTNIDSSAYTGSFAGTASRTFPGALGFTHRVSICGGSSCGSSVTVMQALTVHELCTVGSCVPTAVAINPDAHFTGVQTADKVVIFPRGGTTYSTMTGFITTHSGTAQYLLAGLTPGTYNITVGGSAVTGSPFTVLTGDNSLYFESTSGVVSINGSVAAAAAAGAAMTSAGSLSAGGRR